jgi:hypothetical protein
VLYGIHGSRGKSIDFMELLYDGCVDLEVVELFQTNPYLKDYISYKVNPTR